jgi:hypothetical protein
MPLAGGIFEEGDPLQEAVLKQAVQRINQDLSILPRHTLTVRPETIPTDSSFHTTRAGNLLFTPLYGWQGRFN